MVRKSGFSPAVHHIAIMHVQNKHKMHFVVPLSTMSKILMCLLKFVSFYQNGKFITTIVAFMASNRFKCNSKH